MRHGLHRHDGATSTQVRHGEKGRSENRGHGLIVGEREKNRRREHQNSCCML